jgi:hypothetical protein
MGILAFMKKSQTKKRQYYTPYNAGRPGRVQMAQCTIFGTMSRRGAAAEAM